MCEHREAGQYPQLYISNTILEMARLCFLLCSHFVLTRHQDGSCTPYALPRILSCNRRHAPPFMN